MLITKKCNIRFSPWLRALLFCVITAGSMTTNAEHVTAAVAANFSGAMKKIAEQFTEETGHTVTLVFGSSGKFFAQIVNGAPFEVFLSADQEKPNALEQQQLTVPESRFTYALGGLALWSADDSLLKGGASVLTAGNFNKLAIANPRHAPYGQAAQEVLLALGIEREVRQKMVSGENITQAYQFVSTGNAEVGFVALSQVVRDGRLVSGSAWVVPAELYKPIKQDTVLLKKGETNPAAIALLDFIKGPKGRAIIQSFGYGLSVSG